MCAPKHGFACHSLVSLTVDGAHTAAGTRLDLSDRRLLSGGSDSSDLQKPLGELNPLVTHKYCICILYSVLYSLLVWSPVIARQGPFARMSAGGG